MALEFVGRVVYLQRINRLRKKDRSFCFSPFQIWFPVFVVKKKRIWKRIEAFAPPEKPLPSSSSIGSGLRVFNYGEIVFWCESVGEKVEYIKPFLG